MARLQAGDQRRILIITSSHDDYFCQNLLIDEAEGFKGKHCYQVQSCIPAGALAICQQDPHECILLDWESRDLDGAELLAQLDAQGIPVVILVSAANEQSLADIIHADRDYLVKETLTRAFLSSMIQNAIAKAELKQKLNIAETRLHNYEATIKSSDDISDRKLSEIKLRESEERWELALGANKDGIWDHNLITDKHFLSKRCLEIVGYTFEEINTFDRWFSFVHPDDVLELQNALDRYLSRETPDYTVQYRMKCKDDHYKWIESRGKAIWNDQGNPVRMLGSIADISDRVAADTILYQYERVVSATQDGIALIDRNYTYRLVNDVYLDRNGKKRSEILGYSVADLMGESVFEELVKPRLDLCLAGEVQQYEAWFDYKNVGRRFISVTYSPNLEPDGTITGVVVSTHDLTKLKQAEIALTNSERSLSNLIGNLPGYIFKIHNDSTYTTEFVSQGVEAITGYSQAEYLIERSISCQQIVHPDDVEFGWEILRNAIAARQPYQYEYRIITKTGGVKWVWVQGLGIYDENGDLLFLEGFITDISDRKQAEADLQQLNNELELRVARRTEALSKSETILQEAQAIAHLGNWELDVKTGAVTRSAEMLRILGLTPEQAELSYSEIKHFLHPDDSKTLDRLLDRATQEGLPYETDLRFTRADGTSRYMLSKGKPVFNHEGLVTQVLGVAMDITDRKLAELELQENKQFVQQIVESSPNILYLYNIQDQRNVYSNRRIYDILGYTPQEIQDMGTSIFLSLIHPDDLAKIPANMEQIVNAPDGEILEMEYRMRRANGEWCWLVSRNSIFSRDLDGNVLLMIGSAQDITDRKNAEIQIQQQSARQTLLQEITQRIRQSLDLQIIFETATIEIRGFLRSDRVAIFKFDPNSNFNDGEFVAEAVENGFDSVLAKRFHDHCFGEQYTGAYHHGAFQAVDDIYNSELSECHINILSAFQIRANLVVPLLNGNTLWGLICIHQCSSTRHWMSADIELVQQISNQLAIAVQQASLFQQVQTDLVDKEKLYRLLANELFQKKVLLKEVHHRVKNNLQIMSSLLRMQFRKAAPELRILVEDYQNRIQSMALIHAQLHQNDDLAHINLHDYIFDLTSNLIQCYGINSEVIQCNLEVGNIFLPLDQSVPIGLIINELVSNSLKHAFPQGSGEINIQLAQVGDRYHLKMSDNGTGIPADLDLQNTDSLGMQLVYSLTDQLEAKITHTNNNGSQFLLNFPVL
jgi:PAS domain S-box-containing protein